MMAMVSANDLMSLYVGLELQSLSLYVLAAIKRDDGKSTEAGLKYFVLGALSSGMLLYGASLIYGFTGHTNLQEIVLAIASEGRSIGLIFGLVFLLAGVAFKISAVPFHMWTPDVYEGAPTPVTAFFAMGPKVAAMALLVRLVMDTFQGITHDWQQIVIFLSIASMVLAAFAAIGQKSIKRLIAYSSIGHVGFALVGLSSGTQVGVEGVAIYMAIYVAMTVGLFACILSLRTEAGYVENISDLAGAAQARPFVAAVMAVMMFSLIGMPPLAGFFAKWHAFLAAIDAQLYVLAVIGVLASAVSAFYYLRIVKVMYFDEPVAKFEAVPAELNIIMAVSGFLIVTYYFTVGSPLATFAHTAAGSLF
jgi:NADH-quinone oxidoreductase subunit N